MRWTLLLVACLALAGVGQPRESQAQTVAIPAPQQMERSDHDEVGIYATVRGNTERLTSEDLSGVTNSRYFQGYPDRAFRLNFEGDVLLRCTEAYKCEILRDLKLPVLTSAALDIAEKISARHAPYPFDLTISFRILSLDDRDQIVDWAPSACPDPSFGSLENESARRALAISGRCIQTNSSSRP